LTQEVKEFILLRCRGYIGDVRLLREIEKAKGQSIPHKRRTEPRVERKADAITKIKREIKYKASNEKGHTLS
jgi:hypothetical protein